MLGNMFWYRSLFQNINAEKWQKTVGRYVDIFTLVKINISPKKSRVNHTLKEQFMPSMQRCPTLWFLCGYKDVHRHRLSFTSHCKLRSDLCSHGVTDERFLCSSQFFFPYTLIKFDFEREEPIRNSEGMCIEAATGESTTKLGSKITFFFCW